MQVVITTYLNTYGWFWKVLRASDRAPLRSSVFGNSTQGESLDEAIDLCDKRGWKVLEVL